MEEITDLDDAFMDIINSKNKAQLQNDESKSLNATHEK